MPVIHIKKHESNYVQLDKRPLSDDRLSFKAKGVWAYCMSKPPEWMINISDLVKRSTDGEHAIRSAIKELIDLSYAKRVRVTNEAGKVERWEIYMFEIPQKPDVGFPDVGFPDVGFPDVGFPDVENREHSNNESSNNESIKNDLTDSPGPDGRELSNPEPIIDHDLEMIFGELRDHELDEKPKKERKKSTLILALEALERAFADARGCSVPSWETDKQARANQVNWRAPLKALYKECNNNLDLALEIIRVDVGDYMNGKKDPRFPMIAPRSFESRFVARALDMKNSNGNGKGNFPSWERHIIINNGKIFDWVRGEVTEETEIGKWIIENPDAKRVPPELLP